MIIGEMVGLGPRCMSWFLQDAASICCSSLICLRTGEAGADKASTSSLYLLGSGIIPGIMDPGAQSTVR